MWWSVRSFFLISIPNEQLAQWCQSVITLFALLLKDNITPNDNSYQATLMNGISGRHQKKDEPVDYFDEKRISSASLLKMLGMTILDAVKLRKSGKLGHETYTT